jgi:hypothetical protein
LLSTLFVVIEAGEGRDLCRAVYTKANRTVMRYAPDFVLVFGATPQRCALKRSFAKREAQGKRSF